MKSFCCLKIIFPKKAHATGIQNYVTSSFWNRKRLEITVNSCEMEPPVPARLHGFRLNSQLEQNIQWRTGQLVWNADKTVDSWIWYLYENARGLIVEDTLKLQLTAGLKPQRSERILRHFCPSWLLMLCWLWPERTHEHLPYSQMAVSLQLPSNFQISKPEGTI